MQPACCNWFFTDLIKKVIELFWEIYFGVSLNIPNYKFTDRIIKYILVLELEQDNPNEVHVLVNDNILKFFIFEFAIIIDLNASVIQWIFSTQIQRQVYWGESIFLKIIVVSRLDLVERFKFCNADNDQDTAQIIILYFIYTFILYQMNDSHVSIAYFKIVKDGRYRNFPWEKITFDKLFHALRKNVNVINKLYQLGGMSMH